MTEDTHNNLVITTKLLEQKIISLEDKIAVQFIASETARKLAVDNLAGRLETLNHLREQVEQDRSAFMTREQYDANHETLRNELNNLKDRMAELKTTNWTGIFTGGALLISILGGVWFAAINPINTRLDSLTIKTEAQHTISIEQGNTLYGITKDIKELFRRIEIQEHAISK